jgi:TolA-binding protein
MKIGKSFHGFLVVSAACAAFLAASAASAGEIAKRKENQQDRIAQGVKSGQLTARETANLERKEANLNKEIRDMRADNGGKLTPQERAKVNRQQNRLSRQIYRKKHNDQTQPGVKPATRGSHK